MGIRIPGNIQGRGGGKRQLSNISHTVRNGKSGQAAAILEDLVRNCHDTVRNRHGSGGFVRAHNGQPRQRIALIDIFQVDLRIIRIPEGEIGFAQGLGPRAADGRGQKGGPVCKSVFPDCGDAVRDVEPGQLPAFAEGISINADHTVRQGNAGQISAFIKRAVANGFQPVGQRDAGQAWILRESPLFNPGHALGNRHGHGRFIRAGYGQSRQRAVLIEIFQPDLRSAGIPEGEARLTQGLCPAAADGRGQDCGTVREGVLPDPGDAVRNVEPSQLLTSAEGISPNADHAVRQGDIGQIFRFIKRAFANDHQAVGQRDADQIGILGESPVPNHGHTLGNRHGRERFIRAGHRQIDTGVVSGNVLQIDVRILCIPEGEARLTQRLRAAAAHRRGGNGGAAGESVAAHKGDAIRNLDRRQIDAGIKSAFANGREAVRK